MPLKWKIFFALNFVLSLPALIFFILLLINLTNNRFRGGDNSVALLFLSGLLGVTLNGFFNIFLLQRFFPDKYIPAGIKAWSAFFLIINIIISISSLVICIYGATEEFGSENYKGSSAGKTALIIFFSGGWYRLLY